MKKKDGLSPAESGARLALHAEGITMVFYLLGSDRLCLRSVLSLPVPVLLLMIVFVYSVPMLFPL
jgi:hypothetical protein